MTLWSYPFKFHEVIECAKQLTLCGAAMEPFPNPVSFIDEKSALYMIEVIAEQEEKSMFIPSGKLHVTLSI